MDRNPRSQSTEGRRLGFWSPRDLIPSRCGLIKQVCTPNSPRPSSSILYWGWYFPKALLQLETFLCSTTSSDSYCLLTNGNFSHYSHTLCDLALASPSQLPCNPNTQAPGGAYTGFSFSYLSA